MTTTTQATFVPAAEAKLKHLLAQGADEKTIEKAQADVDAELGSADKAELHSARRRRLQDEIRREKNAETEAKRTRALGAFTDKFKKSAPTLILRWHDIEVSLTLDSLLDHVVRESMQEGARRAMRLFQTAYSKEYGESRASIMCDQTPEF